MLIPSAYANIYLYNHLYNGHHDIRESSVELENLIQRRSPAKPGISTLIIPQNNQLATQVFKFKDLFIQVNLHLTFYNKALVSIHSNFRAQVKRKETYPKPY